MLELPSDHHRPHGWLPCFEYCVYDLSLLGSSAAQEENDLWAFDTTIWGNR